MAGKRVIRFIAMHIDEKPALCSDLAQQLDAERTLLHRALKMRYAAHHIDAFVQSAF